MFMLELVPEPVWKTSTGNWSSCSPATTSARRLGIASACSLLDHVELAVDLGRGRLDPGQGVHVVARVVFGAWEPKTGAAGSLWDVLRDRRSAHRPEVVGGVCAEESAALLETFFAGHRGAPPGP